MKQPVPRASRKTYEEIRVEQAILDAVRESYAETDKERELTDRECIQRLYWLWTEMHNPVGMIRDVDPVLNDTQEGSE